MKEHFNFCSVAVPFVNVGNQQALTRKQLEDDSALKDFFLRFRNCFRKDDYLDVYLFEAEGWEAKSNSNQHSMAEGSGQ